jgi:hypothetical protein
MSGNSIDASQRRIWTTSFEARAPERIFWSAQAALQLEILALRHQLHVLERSRPRRVCLTRSDRCFWVWISHAWRAWRTA